MGRRRDRLDKRLANQTATRQENSIKKMLERDRKAEQMKVLLKDGQMPYTKGVMNWLGVQIDKKVSKITEEDVKAFLS